ncbi:hypothetical protein Pla144_42810 [Bythopirellula polymerisocia]|uniref:Uncharacterized protein n=1 Tax=Bythopirellula polymerisocia TaxID=2528003 RepID=A0A5C6CDZ3_9BACT|nr:hypothetical protein Pla144_42810 [Bythopirellula polymerisocia]
MIALQYDSRGMDRNHFNSGIKSAFSDWHDHAVDGDNCFLTINVSKPWELNIAIGIANSAPVRLLPAL